MANPGAFPPDASAPVGQVRLLIGDTANKALSPIVVGQVDYQLFGDADLANFVALAGDNVKRATGYAIQQLALVYTLTGASVKTEDLALDSSKRGSTLSGIAASWFAEAAADELAEDGAVLIVPTGKPRREVRRTWL